MDVYLRDLFQAHQEKQVTLAFPSEPRGVITPGTSQEIPVCLLAEAAGALRHTLRIAVFGSVLPPLVSVCVCGGGGFLFLLHTVSLSSVVFQEVLISCIGQGPIVEVQHQLLDFGKTLVLKDKSRSLQLSNKSPIRAHFTALLV